MLNRLRTNWKYYKTSNPNQRFALLHYSFWILFYRRLLCPILALPLVVIYFALYPFVKIRFIKLIGTAIGHYAMTTELLLCKLDALENDKFINIFYLEHSLFSPPISNMQLHKMWKRIICILPLQCSAMIQSLDKLILLFLNNSAYDIRGAKLRYEHRECRDIDGYFKKSPPHLKFTEAEHEYAKQQLAELNIAPNAKYVCLQVRSSAYNKHFPTWNFPDRNADVLTYLKACNFLAEKGYYVFRMGKVVDNALPTTHPLIIDYANSPMRSDFLDIYLSAHCDFFISTGTGLDSVPQIFRRPALQTNFFILPQVLSWYPNYLFIPKTAIFTESGKSLSFKEQVYFFLDHPEFIKNCDYEKLRHFTKLVGLTLVENSEDEILEVIKEMEARLANTWQETTEDKTLQARFWNAIPKDAKSIEQYDKTRPLHGKIFVKVGAQFLKKNINLL